MQKVEFINTTIIFKDCWDKKEVKKYAQKLDVEGMLYKYRIYYKNIWNDVNNPKLLTFIMLNPSYANQYANDPTINNCIKIAKKEKHDGIEIINKYSLRHPVFNEIKDKLSKEGNPQDLNYNEFAQCNDIVLAWGNKCFSREENINLFDKIINHKSVYILNAKVNINNKYNKMQIRHPDNRAWTRLGGIKNAKLQKININQYLNNEKTIIYPIPTNLDA